MSNSGEQTDFFKMFNPDFDLEETITKRDETAKVDRKNEASPDEIMYMKGLHNGQEVPVPMPKGMDYSGAPAPLVELQKMIHKNPKLMNYMVENVDPDMDMGHRMGVVAAYFNKPLDGTYDLVKLADLLIIELRKEEQNHVVGASGSRLILPS